LVILVGVPVYDRVVGCPFRMAWISLPELQETNPELQIPGRKLSLMLYRSMIANHRSILLLGLLPVRFGFPYRKAWRRGNLQSITGGPYRSFIWDFDTGIP
jgi:hypothetical protein